MIDSWGNMIIQKYCLIPVNGEGDKKLAWPSCSTSPSWGRAVTSYSCKFLRSLATDKKLRQNINSFNMFTPHKTKALVSNILYNHTKVKKRVAANANVHTAGKSQEQTAGNPLNSGQVT